MCMDNEEKSTLLRDVLVRIANDLNLENIQGYIDEFNAIYSGEFRHKYSSITGVLFSIENLDGRDMLPEKIKYIEESITNPETIRGINKLIDHINLENIRMARLNRISEVMATRDTITAIDNKSDELKEKVENIEGDLNKNTVQSITILSIFGAIVMCFSGGFSYISNGMAGLDKIGPYRSAMFMLLAGLVMFNVIFLLLYMIGKLTGNYIGTSSCKCENQVNGCEKKCSGCVKVRYPMVLVINLSAIIGICIIPILSFVDNHGIFVSAVYHGDLCPFIWCMIAIGLLIIVGIIGICIVAKSKCKLTKDSKK